MEKLKRNKEKNRDSESEGNKTNVVFLKNELLKIKGTLKDAGDDTTTVDDQLETQAKAIKKLLSSSPWFSSKTGLLGTPGQITDKAGLGSALKSFIDIAKSTDTPNISALKNEIVSAFREKRGTDFKLLLTVLSNAEVKLTDFLDVFDDNQLYKDIDKAIQATLTDDSSPQLFASPLSPKFSDYMSSLITIATKVEIGGDIVDKLNSGNEGEINSFVDNLKNAQVSLTDFLKPFGGLNQDANKLIAEAIQTKLTGANGLLDQAFFQKITEKSSKITRMRLKRWVMIHPYNR